MEEPQGKLSYVLRRTEGGPHMPARAGVGSGSGP